MEQETLTADTGSQRETPRRRARLKESREPYNRKNACDGCRKAKLRCIDKESPPCERCRAFGLDCTFGQQPQNESSRSLKRRLTAAEDQLRALNRSFTAVETYPISHHPTQSVPGSSGRQTAPDLSITHPAILAPPIDFQTPESSSTSHLNQNSFALGQANLASPSQPIAALGPSPSEQFPTPEMDSPIPVDLRFMNHLRDPLFAAAIGQPSRINIPESPKTAASSLHPDGPRGDGENIRGPVGAVRHSALPQPQDPVELGLCTLQEAERLYKAFFDRSHLFLPIYDPITDSFASLRGRSVMSLNAILLVAKSAEDTGKEPSWLFNRLLDQAGLAIITVLMSHVKHIETLQALTLLACWTDSGWKMAALAVSIAMDMEIHSCLSWLDRRNMARDKKLDQVQNERQAVVGARLWLALFKLRYEYAFNLGRPIASDADELLAIGRRFVEHPLANLGDCRLVASCELLRARFGLYRPYGLHDARTEIEIEDTIRTALTEIGTLLDYWQKYYVNCGVAEVHTVRELLGHEHAHAILHTAAGSLSVTRFDEEILSLPEEKLGWLHLALMAAQQLVHRCLRQPLGQLYAYWTHEQRVGLFFAALYMVRLAKVLPEAGYNDQIAKDTEELAVKSSTGPGRVLGAILHKVLRQARSASTGSLSAQLPPSVTSTQNYTPSTDEAQGLRDNTVGASSATHADGESENSLMLLKDLHSLLVSHDASLVPALALSPGFMSNDAGLDSAMFPTFDSVEDPFASFMSWGRE